MAEKRNPIKSKNNQHQDGQPAQPTNESQPQMQPERPTVRQPTNQSNATKCHHQKWNFVHAQIATANRRNRHIMCAICWTALTSASQFEKHRSGHTHSTLECPTCYKLLSTKYALHAHLKLHSREIPCKFCYLTFSTRAKLDTHLKERHKLHGCDKCGFMANTDTTNISKHSDNHRGTASGYDQKPSPRAPSAPEKKKRESGTAVVNSTPPQAHLLQNTKMEKNNF